jgi:hypothetical protein
MEENEELEEAGKKVTTGEDDGTTGPAGNTEAEETIPDISKVEENPDPEPGVPDRDI